MRQDAPSAGQVERPIRLPAPTALAAGGAALARAGAGQGPEAGVTPYRRRTAPRLTGG